IPSHPSNASRSSAPRGGRNGANIGKPSQAVKRDSRKMNVFIAHKRDLFEGRKKSAPVVRGADFFSHDHEDQYQLTQARLLPTLRHWQRGGRSRSEIATLVKRFFFTMISQSSNCPPAPSVESLAVPTRCIRTAVPFLNGSSFTVSR